ncbi:glycerol dehydrogenase [Geoalkalibacter sp.]|uniref:glycerol dehydrogenase n=1 Tax=Geoalkalibacter sp. TaxID=3041440 RepID=UPI00272E1F91|nr:glycerol dehydrogenase [Geoalkalibacter sp.]
MSRILLSTSRYIQGAGAIDDIGKHAVLLGDNALVIGGRTALNICGAAITASLAAQGIACGQELFGGVSSRKEINRLAERAHDQGANLIIALGGGASIDAGKAVSHEMNLPVIVVPTTAATDAPCSALSVVYREDGVFENYLYLRRNPDCVLVDTAVIADSPAKFLVAGMGDAVAGVWESGTCARSGKANAFCGGQTPTLAVLALSRLCYETLLESGLQAKLAVEKNLVTPAVEAIVEANTLLSGLSSENGGHAAAHSIHNGLTTLPATRDKLHGEKVAFGVLAQLVLEGRPLRDIREVQAFCAGVGLPICLAELNLPDPSREDIRQVAETAVAEGETIHATWFPVTAAMVEAAIWSADALGRDYRKNQPG